MVIKLRERSQITLPREIIKKLNIKTGDTLEVKLEGDKIVVTPVLIIDRSQAWFWSKQWQDKEREVEEDIGEGRLTSAENINDLLKNCKTNICNF